MFLVVVVRLDFDFDVEWTVNGDLMSDVTLQRRHAKLATMTVSVAACLPPAARLAIYFTMPLCLSAVAAAAVVAVDSAVHPPLVRPSVARSSLLDRLPFASLFLPCPFLPCVKPFSPFRG